MVEQSDLEITQRHCINVMFSVSYIRLVVMVNGPGSVHDATASQSIGPGSGIPFSSHSISYSAQLPLKGSIAKP